MPFVRHHLFDRSVEIRERTFGDRHRLTDEERNLLLRRLFFRLVGDAEEAVHFVGTQRLRKRAIVSDELDDALNAVDDVRRLLIHRPSRPARSPDRASVRR